MQTIALRALLCQHPLNAKSLIESLPNAPCCTPSMLLLPHALQKDSEFKRFRPSITAILSSAACMDPDINLSLATFWHSLAESPRIDSPGCAESCKSSFDGECNSNKSERTSPNMPSPTAESQAGMKAESTATFPLGKDSHILQTVALRAFLRRVNTLSMQNLCLNLFQMPHAAPHRCCFCLKPFKKTLSSKDSGPASLQPCPLPACMDPDINLPLVTFWHSLAENSTLWAFGSCS